MRPFSSTIVLTFALLATGVPAWAANPAIAVGSVTIALQGSASIDIPFAAGDHAVSGIQFDIRYPAQALTLTVAVGGASNDAGKLLYTSTPQPDVLRVLIVGWNQTTIASGVVAALTVQAKADTPIGVYSLSIENTTATDAAESAVDLSASGGSITVTTAIAEPLVAAITNAASSATGAVAPGEMVVIYGSSLGGAAIVTLQLTSEGKVSTTLADTRVLFDGTAAPLLYTSANQVSAIVPYGLDGHNQTSIKVEYQGIRSAPFDVPVTNAAPGLFTANSSGSGQGAIVNQDGSINTPANPASPGSLVSIYGTGDGQTLPAGADGILIQGTAALRYTLLPVTASIGGQGADVVYTGSVGGQVAGIFQANVRIPNNLSGGSLPVRLTVGSASSQPGVTIAVQ